MSLKEESIKILNLAYQYALKNPNFSCSYQEFIDYVIDNKHLTYKYILFTALLSKATDVNINPLCLQKRSNLAGSYDARTICHAVIVPFEIEILQKALGGSNEPFLNKPARFPELNKTNAVRRGNDQSILNALCDNLPLITSSDEAYHCLVYLLCKLIQIRDKKNKLLNFTIIDNDNSSIKLLKYINESLKNSYEGEVLTLMVAGIYHLIFVDNPDIFIEVHPVNQSGASNREVSDLDIYINERLLLSNELKDKRYNKTDVKHAADKVINAGGKKMFFIEGPRGIKDSDFTNSIQNEYMSRNFMLNILQYNFFLSVTISLLKNTDCKEFVKFILKTAYENKFKKEVISYLYELAQQILGITSD